MPFNSYSSCLQNKQSVQTSSALEAYRERDAVRLVVNETEYCIPLSFAKSICDLLSITVYDESIVGLMAKRRILSNENDRLKEKLQNAFQYHRRKQRGTTWKKSQ